MSYAKSRLFLGMTTVGTIVLLSTGILSFAFTNSLTVHARQYRCSGKHSVFDLYFAFICLFLLDVLGGFNFKRYSNLEGKFEQWLITLRA